ncbi:MAG TPA: cytochrome bc complex cytochrome b subunit [Terracidiphilus sp.]|nr:cytochrome bc complex cytochrome b subunit [Terracidiphilus sp.]
MIESIAGWLDSRTRAAKFVRRMLNHVFPDHWSFMLGEIALYSFVILVLTGAFLGFFYNGSEAHVTYSGPYHPLDGVRMSAAFESVLHISFGIPAGLLIRQMHHWAADIFIAAITAHLARIYFTAAYRKPRELNWIIGLTLLVLALANGFFGYSMCDDLLSGAGLRIGYAILLSVPFIGPWFAFLVFGGTVPNTATIPRMYEWHIFLVPALLAVLIGAHLALIWRQLHTNYPGKGRNDKLIVGSRFWPAYTIKSIALFLAVFALVAALGAWAQIDPIWVYGPYKPVGIVPGAQPDWYLGWVEGAMRLFPGVNLRFWGYLIPELFFPGFLFPFLLFVVLYFVPFLDKLITGDVRAHNVLRLPSFHPLGTSFGCSVFAFLIVLEFAGADDVLALAAGTSVIAIRTLLRVLVFVVPAFIGIITYILCQASRRKHSRLKASTPEQKSTA